jgi:hypothetical protein
LENQCGSWKNKNLCEEKNPFQASLAEKPLLKGKMRMLSVTHVTYIDVFVILKRKCLWRGRLDGVQLVIGLTFATWLCVLLSHHENNLFPRETLIVLSYESRDDPSITSILPVRMGL